MVQFHFQITCSFYIYLFTDLIFYIVSSDVHVVYLFPLHTQVYAVTGSLLEKSVSEDKPFVWKRLSFVLDYCRYTIKYIMGIILRSNERVLELSVIKIVWTQ